MFRLIIAYIFQYSIKLPIISVAIITDGQMNSNAEIKRQILEIIEQVFALFCLFDII